MCGSVTSLEGLHVTQKYRDRTHQASGAECHVFWRGLADYSQIDAMGSWYQLVNFEPTRAWRRQKGEIKIDWDGTTGVPRS